MSSKLCHKTYKRAHAYILEFYYYLHFLWVNTVLCSICLNPLHHVCVFECMCVCGVYKLAVENIRIYMLIIILRKFVTRVVVCSTVHMCIKRIHLCTLGSGATGISRGSDFSVLHWPPQCVIKRACVVALKTQHARLFSLQPQMNCYDDERTSACLRCNVRLIMHIAYMQLVCM